MRVWLIVKGLPSSTEGGRKEGDTEQLVLSDELPAKPGLKGILGLQPSNLPEVVTKTGEACGTIRLMRVASWPILPLGGCWLLQRLLGKLHSTQAFPRTPSANTGTCSDTHDTPLRPCITHPYLRSFFLLCFIPAKAMFRLELPEQPQCWVLTPQLLFVSRCL